jgi:DNA-binding CsgD family transcriptional regulator
MVFPRPSAFRGRSSERETLDRLLERVRDGMGATLVIRGEPGVGKTALLRYAARQASGFRVAQIAGVESETELPFAGLHQLCAPLLRRLDRLAEPQRTALRRALGLAAGPAPDRFLVGLAVLGLLAATTDERPLLCLVDDAHRLDGASAQVLGFVARRLRAEAVAMVFAVRPTGGEGDLAGLPELAVEGLADEDARALLASAVPGVLDERVRDRIVAETRGIPSALLELPRTMVAAELASGFALPDAGDLPRLVEEHYRRRLEPLPEDTRRLMLLAAADPVGDATLLWRAARTLGIERDAGRAAASERLLEIGAHVRFRHPLARAAVYRAARPEDRRAAHAALEVATDGAADPDRRAWHRAHAASAPDEGVAGELLRLVGRAEQRGGIAATAAFWDRAVALTPDPADRARRALAAAEATFAAGDAAGAEALLATAEAGPLDEMGPARVQRLRGRIAFDRRRGRDAPPLLLQAAQRLEPLDADLARDTYLEALIAAMSAARLADGAGVTDVALAARAAPLGPEPLPAGRLLLRGLATRLTNGYAAAAPDMKAALRAHRADERRPDWLSTAFTIAAQDLWDDDAWFELAARQTQLARDTGTLSLLPYALDHLAGHHVQAGALSLAAALLAEADGMAGRARADPPPAVPLLLAAWRGHASTTLQLAAAVTREARVHGEGSAITAAEHAMAVLYNGLGQYELALEAARKAAAADEVATASWALSELVEAATRSGRPELAGAAADRLSRRARASATAWAKGADARARALVEQGARAERLHRDAIGWLGRTRMAAHLARARLTYGEWLRREGRRLDAREQLREAHEAFAAIGAHGFADRARRELLATGEKVRKRRDDTRDELTPQELHIARLARDGRTNPEIGAELFISPRTVEWHLRKVFAKLGISSRMGLHAALPSADRESAPAA